MQLLLINLECVGGSQFNPALLSMKVMSLGGVTGACIDFSI